MHVHLLLIAVGIFWILSIVGLGVWWYWHRTRRRRSLPDACVEALAVVELPADRAVQADSSAPGEEPAGCGHGTASAEGALPQGCEKPRGSVPSLRFPYPQLQWMAPCKRGRLPTADDFVPVECHELFGDGVSFYTDAVSEHDTLVVSLGTRATMIFMLARVVAHRAQPEDTPPRLLVECRFIRRVREKAAGWSRVLKSCELVQEPQIS